MRAEYINGGEYLYLMDSTLYSKEYVEDILNKSQVEVLRFKDLSLFNPLRVVSVSKTHPIPFPMEAVYGYILNFRGMPLIDIQKYLTCVFSIGFAWMKL